MKRIISLALSIAMALSLGVTSAAAVDITTGPVEVIVDGVTIRVNGDTPSVMPLYIGTTIYNEVKQANSTLVSSFRCRAEYGNKCTVTLKNDGTSDLIFELGDNWYSKIVSPGKTDVVPIETTDGSPLQITVDVRVEPLGNPSGTYTVTAVQYSA